MVIDAAREADKKEISTAVREWRGVVRVILAAVAIIWAIFQLYTAATVPLPFMRQGAIHLMFMFTLILLWNSASKRERMGRWPLTRDITLTVIVLAALIRPVMVGGGAIEAEEMAFLSVEDWAASIALILITLEANRRAMGWTLPIVTVIFALYALLGEYVPGWLNHGGVSLQMFVASTYLSDIGIFGLSLQVSSTLVYVLVAFGGFLLMVGGGQAFMDLAAALVGRYRGGPAKISVLGSALFGTMSGSPMANVATVGVLTIPLMKKTGYRPHFAAAVEAVSSTGGQIMPPVMGIAAFIMVELLGISYGRLIIYAALPAILYYLAVLFMVDFEAVKTGLRGLPKAELPSARAVMAKNWHLLISPLVLVGLLVVMQWGAAAAAFWAIAIMILTHLIAQFITKRRLDFMPILHGAEQGSKGMLGIASSCATLGIIMLSIDMTGLGLKISILLTELSGGNLWLLLVFTMIASLILGMGLPAVLCYILLAVVAAPSLISAGISPVAAHLFVFYFGIISCITPPVALASIVAAGIAEASPWTTGWTAFRLGTAAYIVPFMFAVSPELLLDGPIPRVVLAATTAILGIYALAAGVQGYLITKVGIPGRVLLIGSSLALIGVGVYWDLLGVGLLAVVAIANLISSRRVSGRARIAGVSTPPLA